MQITPHIHIWTDPVLICSRQMQFWNWLIRAVKAWCRCFYWSGKHFISWDAYKKRVNMVFVK